MPHSGIAIHESRNAGVIEYFRPKPVTQASVLRTLTAASRGKKPSDLLMRAQRLAETIARRPVRADPPLSQSLDEVPDPWFGLGTHPDIIEVVWKLDGSLPNRCRWVLWGYPALVHPETGIVFAVGFGTIGIILRLSLDALRAADPQVVSAIKRGNFARTYDIASAGPEWRFISPGPAAITMCREAYDFAGKPS